MASAAQPGVGQGSSTPHKINHQQVAAHAQEILRALIRQYNEDQAFLDTDHSKEGLIFRCAGSVSLLLLINAFESLVGESGWTEIVIKEFKAVVTHVKLKGYDATPLLEEKRTRELFSPSANPQRAYLDSVSWVLSFAIQLRYAFRTGRLRQLSSGTEHAELQKTIIDTILSTLKIIQEACCLQGGWGFATGCTEPNLYYSYAVSEGLADFGDYVLGETKEVATEDAELLRTFPRDLKDLVNECRWRTAQWLDKTYIETLGADNLLPPGSELANQEARERSDKNQFMRLYYTCFVIDMLVINIPEEKLTPEFKKDLYRRIEHAIYLSRILLAKALPTEWWANANMSSLPLVWQELEGDFTAYSQVQDKLKEPGLAPLILRCNALYAYFISEGGDKKVSDLFNLIMEERATKKGHAGLWDKHSYDLLVTERAIEALVDFDDYLLKFEEGKVTQQIVGDGLAPSPASELEALLNRMITAKLSARSQAQPSAATDIDEVSLLGKLASALTGFNAHLQGNTLEEVPVPDTLSQELCVQLEELIFTLFVKRLCRSVPENKAETVQSNATRNNDAVLRKVASFYATDAAFTLAEPLGWLLERTLKK